MRFFAPWPLLWLAALFGGTLRCGQTPLIERIARRSMPGLSPPLCRYTRRLTALWCGYFMAAAALSAAGAWSGGTGAASVGAAVLLGSVLMFAGERWVRRWIFPHEAFPGLLQQVRDTWAAFRSAGSAATRGRP